MDRQLKSDLVDKLGGLYSSHNYVFIINTSGLTSNSSNDIRRKFSNAEAQAIVVKNTLNKIAIDKTNHSVVESYLVGQNMTVFANDPVSVSKIIVDYTKGKKSGVEVIGISDGKKFYDNKYVERLAKMPSMDVIRAKLLAALQAVPTKIAYSLSYNATSVLRVISSKFEQK